MTADQEIQHLRSENERLRDLMNRRPAYNAGLVANYVHWSALVYASDQASLEMQFVRDGAIPRH